MDSLIEIPEQYQIDEEGTRKEKGLPAEQDSRLKVLTHKELMTVKTPPRVCLLQPRLPRQGPAMI